eukprot:CAMPEP_0196761858 /NCGR_PEP_ID=MMETSP1095-20130614/1165_1 /TAXON_ID=96789 ORGANISM="Chromulina nebulosa, Strain UTEXLB2642" /NCGR_SAMPLE_ID=MMETSP1095 /ASSEMBLY_ACC=CAM_ASM_000446 /LENGTH=283 /DNA_ID=CAMNT_0042111897 /DNA_START=962 /DNA_END=1809 /DNA_ORIENTATION=+
MAVLSKHSLQVVAPYGYCHLDDRSGSFIILELSKYGSIHSIINTTHSIPLSIKIKWCMESLQAIKFIHSKNYIHQDIKPHNLLVFSNLNVKLTDFGAVQEMQSDVTHMTLDVVTGTEGFKDPEYVITRHTSKASDIYSWTLTALHIMYGNNKRDLRWSDEEFIEKVIDSMELPEGDTKLALENVFSKGSLKTKDKRWTAERLLEKLLLIEKDVIFHNSNHDEDINRIESSLETRYQSQLYESPDSINISTPVTISTTNTTNISNTPTNPSTKSIQTVANYLST